MTPPLTVTLPADITEQAQAIAEITQQPVEAIVLRHLRTLRAPDSALPAEVLSELDALPYLSDDALLAIAREQLPPEVQARAEFLLVTAEPTSQEQTEIAALLDRADRLMLRKAEATVLLTRRGYSMKHVPND